MAFAKYTLIIGGLALVWACGGGMATTGDPNHWHAKVYRGTEGKVEAWLVEEGGEIEPGISRPGPEERSEDRGRVI